MMDMPMVPPAAILVPLGMDCSHAGAVMELIAGLPLVLVQLIVRCCWSELKAVAKKKRVALSSV